MSSKILPKLITIVGPTAAGKTDWALRLAKEFGGEVISADSRQMYKKMNIGTAKPQGAWEWVGLKKQYLVEGIPHHLIDFLDPGKIYTAAHFRDSALGFAKLAYKRKHIPFVVGGTGLYISSLIDNYRIPLIAPNKKLRKSLQEKTPEELIKLLQSLDPETAETIDHKNVRRIIRALEVCIMTGVPFSAQRERGEALFEVLQIGVDTPRETLYGRINERVDNMIKQGLLQEVESLMKQKYSWQLPSMSGVGYRQFESFFSEKKQLTDVVDLIKRDTRRYARRQLTWFRRDPRIHWLRSYDEAKELISRFLAGENVTPEEIVAK